MKSKAHIISDFCGLSDMVAEKVYKHMEPADCFCGTNVLSHANDFQFSQKVMDFIKDAVNEKIEKEQS